MFATDPLFQTFPIPLINDRTNKATDRFSQFSTFQSRIANAQPPVPSDIIELVNRTVETTQARIPALERSIQEIRQEGELS
jgi:hypothetical protein